LKLNVTIKDLELTVVSLYMPEGYTVEMQFLRTHGSF